MMLPGIRTWTIFYLLSFASLLWAAFLTAQGIMLWVSLMLIILVTGVNFSTVFIQIKRYAARQEFQRSLTEAVDRTQDKKKGPFRR
jgi:Flp pilus assembly protein TadB